MVLGDDFTRPAVINGHGKTSGKPPESHMTASVGADAPVPIGSESCFFTNVYMDVREGETAAALRRFRDLILRVTVAVDDVLR